MKIAQTLRRASLAGVAALFAASATSAFAAGPACFKVPAEKLGMQLYSVRSELSAPPAAVPPGAPRPPASPADPARIDATLGALQRMGWRNIENFGGNQGLGDAAYKALFDKHQLKVVAAHETNQDAGFPEALARAKLFGQKYVGWSTWGAPGLSTIEQVLATAAHANAAGKLAREQGLTFYLHNHQTEFTNVYAYDIDGDGKTEKVTAWEIVAAKTDPRYVSFEVDIHWAHLAMGVDRYPELMSFLEKHRDRVVMLHIKDTMADGKMADLGVGVTPWDKIVTAAGPQVAYYLWEFDGPPNPMQSAKIAYDYLSCTK